MALCWSWEGGIVWLMRLVKVGRVVWVVRRGVAWLLVGVVGLAMGLFSGVGVAVGLSGVVATAGVTKDAGVVPGEVLSRRTVSSRTRVNADSSLSTEVFAEPQWVRQDGRWVDVDPSLVVQGDGSLVPRATVVPMWFGGAGQREVLRLGGPGRSLSWSWVGKLPAPVVVGDVATYPEVMPGVDLRVQASARGVSEVLVVKTREAGRSAAVRHVSFGVSTQGLSVSTNSSGGLVLTDVSGVTVFRGAQPAMWDSGADSVLSAQSVSAGSARGVAAGVRGPREGDRVRPIVLGVSKSAMTVTADAAFLDDPATRYPVMIDPPISAVMYSTTVAGAISGNHAMVDAAYPSVPYWNWTGDQGVGYQNFSAWSKKRLLYQFDTNALLGTDVKSAVFSATVVHSAYCAAPRTVYLWKIGAFDSSTTWNRMPAFIGQLDGRSTSAGRYCSPTEALMEWSAFGAVREQVAAGQRYTYLGLLGSETDPYSWKRFRNDAKLTVTYNHVPSTATALGTVYPTTSVCGTASAPVQLNPAATFALTAAGSDPDGSQQTLSMYFEVWERSGPLVYTGWSAGRSGSTWLQVFSPLPALPSLVDGKTYLFWAHTYDGVDNGPWSSQCFFTVDRSAPEPPSVTFQDHVDVIYSGSSDPAYPASTVAHATFSSDVVGAVWAVNQSPSDPGLVPGPGLPATSWTVTAPATYGDYYVHLIVTDSAGNRSHAVAPLQVASLGDPTAGRWRFDDMCPVGLGCARPEAWSAAADARTTAFGTPSPSAPVPSSMGWPGGLVSAMGSSVPATSVDPTTDFAVHLSGGSGELGVAGASGLASSSGSFGVAVQVRPSWADATTEQVLATDGSSFTLAVASVGPQRQDPNGGEPVRDVVVDFTVTPTAGPALVGRASVPNWLQGQYLMVVGEYNAKTREVSVAVPDHPEARVQPSVLGSGQTRAPSSPALSVGATSTGLLPLRGDVDDVFTFASVLSDPQMAMLEGL